jgi:hypothetical protein
MLYNLPFGFRDFLISISASDITTEKQINEQDKKKKYAKETMEIRV